MRVVRECYSRPMPVPRQDQVNDINGDTRSGQLVMKVLAYYRRKNLVDRCCGVISGLSSFGFVPTHGTVVAVV